MKGFEFSQGVPCDVTALNDVLQDDFMTNPTVKGDKATSLSPNVALQHMNVFCKRGLVFLFSSRLPRIQDIACMIDEGFGYYVVDKIFYTGNSLLEVLFLAQEDQDIVLSTPSMLLHGTVIHVMPAD